MKKLNLVLILILLVVTSFNNSKWHAAPAKIATAFTPYSLLSYVATNSGSELHNNYFIKADSYDTIIGKLHALNKPHLYNDEGLRVLMVPDESCGTPILLPSFSANLDDYKIEVADTLSNLLNAFQLISTEHINNDWPTAILYWSKSLGLAKEDHVFLWELAFLKRFDGKINIVKVNTDANSTWTADAQQKTLGTIQKILDIVSATEGFK